MNKKNKAFARKNHFLAGGLVILVIAGIFFLSTDKGKDLFGNRLKYYASRANQGKFRDSAKPIKDEYIVVFNDDANPDVDASRLSGKYNSQAKHVYHDAVKGFAAKLTESQAKAISEDPSVAYVEEDGIIDANTIQAEPGWALDRIDQRNLPLDLTYNYNAAGRGVNIYIIDTGVLTTHPDFEGRAFIGTSTASGSYDVNNCNSHGTMVAGIAGGKFTGVARQAKIYSVRVFPCLGYASVSDVIAGVDWVTRHAVKPAVANMSLGGGYSSTLNSAVSKSIQSGVTYAIAAGNEGSDACYSSPSAVPGALTTGASGKNNDGVTNDEEIVWSNYGPCVDVLSPGVGAWTLYGLRDSNGSIAPYTYFSGTSAATPFTAGVAALYLETHPAASPSEVATAVTQSATQGVLTMLHSSTPNRLIHSLLSSPSSGPDTYPPEIITNPQIGTAVRKGQFKFSASASDPSGIANITISLDNSVIKSCIEITTCSVSISASNLTSGQHTLTTTATDKASTPNTTTKSITLYK